MNRRTQDLTRRELEVLALVHLGLTNDEIAERLGISSDGVKYHITQILTKMSVSSRYEAVAVAYGERRRPWWSAAVASAIAKAVVVAAALTATAFLALLLWSVLATEDSEEPPDITDLTVPDVIASVKGAVTSPGQVFHSQIEAIVQAEGETTPYFTMEIWVDAGRETLRSEYHLAPEQDAYDRATEATAIISGQFMYVPDDPNEALRHELEETSCPGVDSAWMATLLLCGADWTSTAPSPLGEPVIESGEFRGRSAVVLVYEDSRAVSDPDALPVSPPPLATGPMPVATSVAVTQPPAETQTITATWRVYIDADDYLPLAYTFTQQADGDRAGIVEAVYENEFVPLDDEIEARLDPRSIGYGAENAEALLDEIEGRVPVYWLGEEFQGDGLGELVLARILVGEQYGGLPDQVYRVGGELIYEAPEGYPGVRLLLWKKDDWEAFLSTREGRVLTDPSCAQTQEGQTGDTPSTVYLLPPIEFPGSSEQAPNESQCNYERRQVALVDRVIGAVESGEVVVQVRQDGYAETPAEMQSLLRHLRPR